MGFGSRELCERGQKNPLFFGVLATVSQGRLVPVPGGVLIKDAAGSVLGAVGISGDTSDKDESLARSPASRRRAEGRGGGVIPAAESDGEFCSERCGPRHDGAVQATSGEFAGW
jgi:hypothetical protein